MLNADRDGFDPSLFDPQGSGQRLVVIIKPAKGIWLDQKVRVRPAPGSGRRVVVIPPELRDRIADRETSEIPIDYASADESSKVTYDRLTEVLSRWQKHLPRLRFKQDHLSSDYIEPIAIKADDVATPDEVGSSIWARLFPFLWS